MNERKEETLVRQDEETASEVNEALPNIGAEAD